MNVPMLLHRPPAAADRLQFKHLSICPQTAYGSNILPVSSRLQPKYFFCISQRFVHAGDDILHILL